MKKDKKIIDDISKIKVEKECKAWLMAEEMHKGKKRRNGQPYMHHIKKTVELLKAMEANDEEITITAILHDVLEDSDNDMWQRNCNIIKMKFGGIIFENVLKLTHKKTDEKSYQEYIDDIIKTKSKVILVKMADIMQNTTDDPTQKQIDKYSIALPKLIKAVYDMKR